MYRTLLPLGLFLTILHTASSVLVIREGNCPNVTGQPSLKLERYMGTWYEYKRFPAAFEFGLDCTKATYTLDSDNEVTVDNVGLLRINVFGERHQIKRKSISGRAFVPDPHRPAELSMSFGPKTYGRFGAGPNYMILSTNYDDYSLVFSCQEFFGLNVQFAWVLTRKQGRVPVNIYRLERRMAAAGIDVSNLKLVDQAQCPADY